jgi:peroxiredoxin
MEKHIPGFIKWADEFKNKGVDKIAVVSTNDAYVLAYWAKQMFNQDRLLFISDGNGKFTKVCKHQHACNLQRYSGDRIWG